MKALMYLLFILLHFSHQTISYSQSNQAIEKDSIIISKSKKPYNGIVPAQNKNSKLYGYVNREKRVLIPFIYEYADAFKDGYAMVILNKKAALIDTTNSIILPFEYESIYSNENGFYRVYKEKKAGIVNLKNEVIVPFEFDFIRSDNNKTFIYQSGDESGFFYDGKRKKISFTINSLKSIDENYFLATTDKDFKLINKKAKILADGFDFLKLIKNDFLIGRKEGKFGCISKSGKSILPFIYNNLGDYSGGLFAAKKGKNWGFVDSLNNEIIPFEYSSAEPFVSGKAIISKDWKYGFINNKNEIIIEPTYDDIKFMASQRVYLLFSHKTFKMYSNSLEELTNEFYQAVAVGKSLKKIQFEENRLLVKKDNLFGFLNNKGEAIIKPQFQSAESFENGVSIVKNEKYGLIDTLGNYIFPMEYDHIKRRRNFITGEIGNLSSATLGDSILLHKIEGKIHAITWGHYILRKEDKFGLFHMDGRKILDVEYDEFEKPSFSPGYLVRKADKWGYYRIDKDKFIIPIEHEKIYTCYNGGAAIYSKNGKDGLLNSEGKEVLPAIYDKISATTMGVVVLKNGKKGLYSGNCEEIFPVIYDEIKPIDYNKYKLSKDGKDEIVELKEDE